MTTPELPEFAYNVQTRAARAHSDSGQDPGTEGRRAARPRAHDAPRPDRRDPRRHRRCPRAPF